MADEPREHIDTEAIIGRVQSETITRMVAELDSRLKNVAAQYKEALEQAQREATSNLDTKAKSLVDELSKKDAAAAQHLASLNSNKGAAETTLKQINEHSTQSKTALDTINQNRDKVVSVGQRAEELNDEIAKLKDQVTAAQEDVESFETNWEEKFTELFNKIEQLLPGATGAGLASGFRKEKFEYESKQRDARIGYILWLIGLILTIAFSPIQVVLTGKYVPLPDNAFEFLERLSWNLPLVFPAIWGAWWYVRRASLYDQLAEEYRQKEAISTAFEGYTKRLVALNQTDVLKQYLLDSLKEICVPPGRIFDKRQHASSPLEDTLERAQAILAAKKPDK